MSSDTNRRGEQRREEILNAAHALFCRQGYHGTSMRQIAKEANIALGGLYNHFTSKENVFRAVFFKYHPSNEVLPAIMQARGETVEDFIRNAAKQMFRTLEKRPDVLNLMFIEIVEFNSQHAFELFASLLPQITQIAARIQQSGGQKLRPIPAMMLIRTYFGMIFAYYLTDLIMAKLAPPELRENAADYFIDIYLHGILADE